MFSLRITSVVASLHHTARPGLCLNRKDDKTFNFQRGLNMMPSSVCVPSPLVKKRRRREDDRRRNLI